MSYTDDIKNELISGHDMNRSLINFLCGDFIGQGVDRVVFEYSLDSKYVVKIEREFPMANMLEWEIWDLVRDRDEAKWFAPCHHISDCGRILIQRKTKPMKKTKDIKIPTYFTDIKVENFGTLGKQLVCHDYSSAIIRFALFGMPKRMVKFKPFM